MSALINILIKTRKIMEKQDAISQQRLKQKASCFRDAFYMPKVE